MKQFTAIFLFFIFSLTTLVPATILNGMGKIAYLIEHYKEHKAENADISFWAFLDLHYGSDFQNHQTAHDHSKLPLKNTPNATINFVLFSDFYQPSLNISYKSSVVFEKKQVMPSFNQNAVSRSLTDIWQPPRLS
jgi:hypothetical protein